MAEKEQKREIKKYYCDFIDYTDDSDAPYIIVGGKKYYVIDILK